MDNIHILSEVDILLINPPQSFSKTKEVSPLFMGEIEPLGLLYLAGALERAGYSVAVFDALRRTSAWIQILDTIRQLRPRAIGLTGVTSNGSVIFRLGKAIQEHFPEIPILAGNLHVSIFHEFYLKNKAVHFVFHGEAEESLPRALPAILDKRYPVGIAGVSWWQEGALQGSQEPQRISQLDHLALPARHLIDMDSYGTFTTSNNIYIPRKGEKTRFLFSSRGCVFNCSFCVCNDHQRFRARSPEAVVDEMELLVHQYRATHLNFLDPLFVGNRERVFKICEEIQKRKLRVSFVSEAHAKLVSLEMLRTIKAAGGYGLYFGIESGNDEVLKTINKNVTKEQITQAVAWAKEAGLKVAGFFMLGLPGDSLSRMQETVDFAKKLRLDLAQFSITVPYPGSVLYSEDSGKELAAPPEADVESTLNHWDRFSPHAALSGTTPVYAPLGLMHGQVLDFQKKAIRSYYLRPAEIFRYARRIKRSNFASLVRAVWKLRGA